MLILPPRITGVDVGLTPFTPATSSRAFRTVCHTAARHLQGRTVEFRSCEGQVTPNFHTAELHLRTGTFVLLCNAHYPWLAALREWPSRTATSGFLSPMN